MYVCKHNVLVYTVDVEVRQQPLEESVFEFYHMGSRDYTQIISLGSK